MKEIVILNKEIPTGENYDVAIEELLEREEYICCGDGCGAHACAIYNIT